MYKYKTFFLKYLDKIYPNKKNMAIMSIILFFTLLPLSSVLLIKIHQVKEAFTPITTQEIIEDDKGAETSMEINLHIPEFMRYKDIDQDNLKAYLEEKNSILSLDNYFQPIIETSKEFNLNPLVLFAIAGHEQGFVPKNHPKAEIIANNPFNVFQSWERYNTDIIDSSKIAARTVVNLLKDRDPDIDPFKWINRKYAQDQNWYKGVKKIYYDLEEYVNSSLE